MTWSEAEGERDKYIPRLHKTAWRGSLRGRGGSGGARKETHHQQRIRVDATSSSAAAAATETETIASETHGAPGVHDQAHWEDQVPGGGTLAVGRGMKSRARGWATEALVGSERDYREAFDRS